MVPSGWEKERLGEITSWSSGGTPSKANIEFWSGTIPWMSAKTMKGTSFSHSNLCISEKGLKAGSKLANKGDLLLLVRGSMLWKRIPVGIVKKDLAFNQDVKCISPKQKKISSGFLLFWFSAHENMLLHMVTGTGIGAGKLDTNELTSLKISLPPFPEQQKIAKILSTWDKAISTTESLIANSQQQKKALMQQLLTSKKRFSGFEGKWVKINLGDVSQISTGSSNRQDSTLEGKYTFFDRSEDIRTSNQYLFDGEAVIIAGEGQDFIPKYFRGKFDLHQRTYAIMNFDKVDGKFLFYYITYFRHYFLRQAVGSTVKSLRLPMFKKMPLLVPATKEEQQKIASVLTAADQETETLQQKLSHLKQEKKALMQQLLTGKRRVVL